ncbi:MAG TPA: alpha/beta hydrolase domain-containing protein, partial [Afipia sp.]
DPRQKFASLDVPFVSIYSEGELWEGASTRQPDTFTGRGGWVTYEVAGGSHGAAETPGLNDKVTFGASPQDMAKTGVQRPPMPAGMMASLMPAGAKPNRMPWAPLARGAYHNLQLWAEKGTRPPQAQPIALETNQAIRRDPAGNAIGGLRLTYLDVPTASHTGYLTAGGGMGGVMGAFKPFSAEELARLYPTPADYLGKFDAATDRLVAGRWLSQADGEAMKKAAKEAPMTN